MWETYSSFANTSGGCIILGVKERADRSRETTGLRNVPKLRKALFDTLHNRSRISVSLLDDSRVTDYEYNGDVILVIEVPKARREEKPVFINGDMWNGTYRRDWEGDYHCSKEAVLAMLRDQTEITPDMKILGNKEVKDFSQDSVRSYRIRYDNSHADHPWSKIKIAVDLKKPFRLNGIYRIDDTPVHVAVREVLASCLVNADYFLDECVKVENYPCQLIFSNSGTIRLGKKQMMHGGKSSPRNKVIMNMFNFIGVGERAGSGVPNVYRIWQDENYEEPTVEELSGREGKICTVVSLPLVEKSLSSGTEKSPEKSPEKGHLALGYAMKGMMKTSFLRLLKFL